LDSGGGLLAIATNIQINTNDYKICKHLPASSGRQVTIFVDLCHKLMKNVNSELNKVKNFILDLIFPKECLGCGREGGYLCACCRSEIELSREFHCALCKKTSLKGGLCPDCSQYTAMKAIWVAADYNQKIIQDLIHNLKYNYLEEISADLAILIMRFLQINNLIQEFRIYPDNFILVPVPLHPKRFLNRGFNQSELLADKLEKLSGLKTVKLLKRIKNTKTQIDLNRSERQINVRDAFEVKTDYPGNKKIILIDDVLTTGSTLKECASVLWQAGYTEIYGLAVAQRED
jgi:ComF family protein